MSGGNFRNARNRCVRVVASSLVGGLLAAPWLTSSTWAAEEAVPEGEPAASTSDDSALTVAGEEKSVVAKRKVSPDPDIAFVTDLAEEEPLQPMVPGTEPTPDLADAPAEPEREPTLADDYAALGDELAGAADRNDATNKTAEDEAGSDVGSDEKSAADVALDEIADEDSADEPAAVQPQTASFLGVTPGESTREDVQKAFGKSSSGAAAGVYRYQLDGFPSVVVRFDEETVSRIDIELYEPVAADQLTTKLGMEGICPVVETDDEGTTESTIYPERGVTFAHRPSVGAAMASDEGSAPVTNDSPTVYGLIVEPINPEHFLRRAETGPARDFVQRITDVETALALDSSNIDARLLLSQLKLTTGDVIQAEHIAAEAVELAPRNDAMRLQWAKTLKYLTRYDQAVEQTRLVIEGRSATQLERAQALEQMGLLAGLGSKQVQAESVPFLNKAIALADPLTTSSDAATASAAQQLLVECHLAVAEQIAAGRWQGKDETVGKWIARASGLAEHMIANGEADMSLRLEVAVSALAAGSQLDPPINPTLWVKEAEQATSDLGLATLDLPARDQLNWQLGLAYFYATEIMHRRSQPDDALKYGQLAEATLVAAADSRRDLPDTDNVLGRLYFQIGAVHAVHFQDHETACQWYDRAAEALMKPVPLTAQTSPAKHGDALVSMGVSYWQIGQRDRAYELTKAGVDLIEQSIAQGLLTKESLEVPQHNLAAMDRVLGRGELVAAEEEMPNSTAAKTQVAQTEKGKSQSSKAQQSQAKKQPVQVARNNNGQRTQHGKPRTQTADRRAATDGQAGTRRR